MNQYSDFQHSLTNQCLNDKFNSPFELSLFAMGVVRQLIVSQHAAGMMGREFQNPAYLTLKEISKLKPGSVDLGHADHISERILQMTIQQEREAAEAAAEASIEHIEEEEDEPLEEIVKPEKKTKKSASKKAAAVSIDDED